MLGCGKTVMSSAIIENLKSSCSNDPSKALTFFFFDFNDRGKQVPELMVKSVVHQLFQQHPKTPAALSEAFCACGNGQQAPSLDCLLQLLQQLSQEFSSTYMILDGLDECPAQDERPNRDELMDTIQQVLKWKNDRLHILVTSRNERDIEHSLEDLMPKENVISLQLGEVHRDIRAYIEERLRVDKRLSKWNANEELRDRIRRVVTSRSQAMYVLRLII